MKNKFLIFIVLVGMISFFACEKDETKAIVSTNPIVPTLIPTSGAITLDRDNFADSLTFDATKADFGFQASVKYILEVALNGTDFESPIQIMSQSMNSTFIITVGDLNTILIQVLPEDVTNDLEWRVIAEIESSDNGSGAIKAISLADPILIKTYGPPSLYLTIDANDQRLVSADNDSIYIGWVYSDGTAFTLTNRDDGKVYGATGGGVVSEGGAAISLAVGVHNITINLKTLIFSSSPEEWGIIGSAIPPYDWSADVNMDFDLDGQFWAITGDFIQGEYKFRANDDWGLNLGDTGPDGNLEEGGANIELAADGNYTIKLFHSRTYSTVGN